MNDIGYSEYAETSKAEVKNGQKTRSQHRSDLENFKRNSKYGEQIAAAEAEYNSLKEQRDEIKKSKQWRDYYERTAGEIEARDAANRMDYTDEQRKNIRPDIDRIDVVFADGESSFKVNNIDTVNKNSYNESRGDIIENSNPNLLANGGISTVSGSRNSIRKQGGNTQKISELLGRNKKNSSIRSGTITAGESGFLDIYKGHSGIHDTKTGQDSRRFWESNVRSLQRTKLKQTDSAGRILSFDLQNKLSHTVLKNEDGTIISLYHWTDKEFGKFEKGDIGFHFGTLDAAWSIQFDKSRDNSGYFKEVYLNIKNPIFLEVDPIKWTALTTTEFLCREGVFTEEEFKYIQNYDPNSFNTEEYNSKSLNAVRSILQEKGYDGIIYTNDYEGGLSVIALYPDQIITIAENGVLKENIGVSLPLGKYDNSSNHQYSVDSDNKKITAICQTVKELRY